ncbi:hypothetical protein B0T11DRAFT_319707 [Plectosphaerella cucumerina]|uniref:Uncharacterized protein n=1 Tax=Plectosphaerella cucumerina TaxID=40658 RepID=A0A8K0X1I0_9PEZI|nr:hypothetical protein B0T11DRAFT_319707 [Plectosphaerella cucumerina]
MTSVQYSLRIKSDHGELSGTQTAIAADQSIVLKPAAGNEQTLRVQLSGSESTLSVQSGGNAAGFLSVRGPSGRGPYQLQASREVSPSGIGSLVYHDSWVTTPAGSLEEVKLSIGNDNINDGYWVAWKDGDDAAAEGWELYWVTPRPYNQGDLEGCIQVDLVLTREG